LLEEKRRDSFMFLPGTPLNSFAFGRKTQRFKNVFTWNSIDHLLEGKHRGKCV
jgi:hypothetical protein